MNENVFSGHVSFCEKVNFDIPLKLNFELTFSKHNFLGTYVFDTENEKYPEKVEFFNNDLKAVFTKLPDQKKFSFKNKIYNHIKAASPMIYDNIMNVIALVKEKENQNLILEGEKKKDLVLIYNKINEFYFANKVGVQIEWAKNPPDKKRKSIILGSYVEDLKLIRISPVLKKDYVPDFFLESVVFHEMLHTLHDAKNVDGRRQVHTKVFKRDEKKIQIL